MKLDFAALAQPAAKAREQLGTVGTTVLARVCASPPAIPGMGTSGDKPAAKVLAADTVLAIPAPCPPVSPPRPHSVDAEELNADVVSPVSPLVPAQTGQIAVAACFEREDVGGKLRRAAVNTCGGCRHLLRQGTCGEPVAAGLLTAEDGFGIVWPPDGHGAVCPAYSVKLRMAAPPEGAEDARPKVRAPSWHLRRDRLLRWGYSEPEAETLADRLARSDREADTRVLCVECSHYRPGRCGNHRAAWLNVPDIGGDFAALMQNCEGFAP